MTVWPFSPHDHLRCIRLSCLSCVVCDFCWSWDVPPPGLDNHFVLINENQRWRTKDRVECCFLDSFSFVYIIELAERKLIGNFLGRRAVRAIIADKYLQFHSFSPFISVNLSNTPHILISIFILSLEICNKRFLILNQTSHCNSQKFFVKGLNLVIDFWRVLA